MQRVPVSLERGIAAIDRERVLGQVVRPEAGECEAPEIGVGGQPGRRPPWVP
jgi:hypothetical protein